MDAANLVLTSYVSLGTKAEYLNQLSLVVYEHALWTSQSAGYSGKPTVFAEWVTCILVFHAYDLLPLNIASMDLLCFEV